MAGALSRPGVLSRPTSAQPEQPDHRALLVAIGPDRWLFLLLGDIDEGARQAPVEIRLENGGMDVAAAGHGRGIAEPRGRPPHRLDDIASGRRTVMLGLEWRLTLLTLIVLT